MMIKNIKKDDVFRVSPSAWGVSLAEDEVAFSIKAQFDPNMPRPGLKAVVVDGKYHSCKPGPKPSKTIATTNVRIQIYFVKIKSLVITIKV